MIAAATYRLLRKQSVYYQFSILYNTTNPSTTNKEHQVSFWYSILIFAGSQPLNKVKCHLRYKEYANRSASAPDKLTFIVTSVSVPHIWYEMFSEVPFDEYYSV
jgi:hypothetical protein